MMNMHKTINISSANSSLQTTFATYKRQLKKKTIQQERIKDKWHQEKLL